MYWMQKERIHASALDVIQFKVHYIIIIGTSQLELGISPFQVWIHVDAVKRTTGISQVANTLKQQCHSLRMSKKFILALLQAKTWR